MNSTETNRSPLSDLYPNSPPMMEFGGWSMPRDFGGIVEEHNSVRNNVGVFDLSHMGRIILSASSDSERVDRLFTRNCSDANPGTALYGFFCDDNGGCIDDAIIYKKSDEKYWLVVNAANREAILDWISDRSSLDTEDRTTDTVFLAIQGPDAPDLIDELGFENFPDVPFHANWTDRTMLASTGYTGEAGGEIWLPSEPGRDLFDRIVGRDVTLCGLGARDTLRLEKGFPLHGHELSESIDPVTAGLDRFIDWDHKFIGRDPLETIKKQGPDQTLIGLKTGSRQSPRRGYSVRDGHQNEVGEVTSGRYSPSLEQGIGIALVENNVEEWDELELEIRGDWVSVEYTHLPFL